MSVTLLLVAVVASMIAAYWIRVLMSGGEKPPTFPGFIPIIGHSYKLLTDSQGIYELIRNVAQFGYQNNGIVTMWLGTKPYYVVMDPQASSLIYKMCLDRNAVTYKFGKPLVGQGLLTAPASIWKVHRKLLNAAFNQQMLDEYITVFNKQARRLVKEMSKEAGGAPFNQMMYSKTVALETISLTAMGVDITDASFNKSFVECCDQISGLLSERFSKIWLHSDIIFSLSNTKKKQDHFKIIVDEVIETALIKRKEELLQHTRLGLSKEKSSGIRRRTYIEILLECGAFSDVAIKNEVVTIIATGADTTANVLSNILTIIGSFPNVQEKILYEIQKELKDCDEDITWADLTRLPYMDAVIKETLRFLTLVPVLFRYIDRDIKTENYTLNAGTDCILLSDGLHKHPCWGPDVNEFKPERWMDPATLPEFASAFVGFGLGKRNCIGKSYAMASLKITLIHVLRKYRISGDYTKMKTEPGLVSLPVSGFEISIQHR